MSAWARERVSFSKNHVLIFNCISNCQIEKMRVTFYKSPNKTFWACFVCMLKMFKSEASLAVSSSKDQIPCKTVVYPFIRFNVTSQKYQQNVPHRETIHRKLLWTVLKAYFSTTLVIFSTELYSVLWLVLFSDTYLHGVAFLTLQNN